MKTSNLKTLFVSSCFFEKAVSAEVMFRIAFAIEDEPLPLCFIRNIREKKIIIESRNKKKEKGNLCRT